jgi:3'(2'), 5'-bisphosphate nucleotidase
LEYSPYIDVLRRLCAEAGQVICDYYHAAEKVKATTKADDSPLTAADLASHQILLSGLATLGLPVLSEESAADVVARRQDWPRYWLVDPLDGTREFIERTGEFTINIALIDNHRAVLGAVYLPLEETLYLGIPGQGAWCYRGEERRAISSRPLPEDGSLVILTSRRHRGEQLDKYLAQLQAKGRKVERQHAGSALKFCGLACGEGDIYPRFAPCSEWDTAAGQALLEAAGGSVLNLEGQSLRYNERESLLNPFFIAATSSAAILGL